MTHQPPADMMAEHNPNHLQGSARTKLVWSILLATTALFSCYMAAGSVLLPVQVAALNPDAKESNLAIVTSISSFFTLFCQPVVGALSDRTRHRLGRRAPWMLGGAFLGGLMLLLIPYLGKNVAIIALMWVLAQVSLNSVQGPLSALVADRLDPNYRGTASAFFGVGSTIGMTAGIVIAGYLVNQLGLGYSIFAIAVMVCVALLVLLNQDRPSTDLPARPFDWGAFARGFLTPFRSRDFTWAFAQRFVMFLGYMGIFGYMFYILTSYIHLSTEEAGVFMGQQSMANAVASVAATFIAGPLSDRIGRRKIFVMVASAFIAVSCLVPWMMPSKTGILIMAVLAGIGFGTYMAVDVALVVDILPNPEDAAKDLGVINIANNVPQMLAPIINAMLIGAVGYVALWPWAIVLVIAASFLVLPIKGVR